MARLLIIGASQGIGLETVKSALAAGHTVRAFARSASKISLDDPYLEKIDGDARESTSITKALNGQDAVIQSLGVALNPETILRGTTLFSEATRTLVDAMTAHGPQRLIVVTGISAGNSREALGPLIGLAFQLSLRRIYNDKDVQEMIVQRSKLDWTIVRPGFLTQGEGPYRALINKDDWRPGPISRSGVAKFIVEHLNDPVYLRQTPLLIA